MRALTAHLGDIRRAWRWAVVLGGAKAAVVAAIFAAIALAGDQVLRGTDPAPALWLAAVAAAGAMLSVILAHVRQRLLERAALWVDHAISHDLLADRLSGGTSAPLAAAADRQIGALRDGLAQGAAGVASDAIWLPVFAVLATVVDWRAAVIAGVVLAIGLGVVVIGASGNGAQAGDNDRLRAQALADGASQNAALVLALGLESGLTTMWSQRQSAAVSASYARLTSAGRWRFAGYLFVCAMLAGVGGLALAGVQDGAISRMDAALGVSIVGWIVLGLGHAIAVSPSLRGARAGWSGLVSASRVGPRQAAGSDTGMVRLDGGSYVYPGRRFVAIDRAHVTVQPGEIVAIAGPAGSGKSTLAALIAGALAPTSGTVDRGRLRIGYVPELPFLLDGTVCQNIARFGAGDLQSAAAAIDRAGVKEIIDALDGGVETLVKFGAMQPSGGLTLREARAVALARAVHAAVDILVIDKPELGLDVRDVHHIGVALQRLRDAGIGILMASNDPRFQALADRFVHVEAGCVIGGSVNARHHCGSTPVRMMRGQHFATAR